MAGGLHQIHTFRQTSPLFVYLNRIPGVISAQGYVDDTTIIGNAQNPDWVIAAADCYSDLASAGFIMDQHTCFRGCITTVTTHNKFPPRCCSREFSHAHWPSLAGAFPQSTASNVLQRLCKLGYNIAIMRVGTYPNEDNSPDAFEQGSSIICVLSYDQAQDILLGIDLHRIGAFANGKCSCKSKSHVLSNFKLRPHGIAVVEKSGCPLLAKHLPLG